LVLGLHLEQDRSDLRFYNPLSGGRLPTPEERIASAEERAAQAEAETERLRRELNELRLKSRPESPE
jgi:hypothetical protein